MSKCKEVNQKTRVLDYIQKNKGITSWEAIKEFGVTRLSAVIYDLRKEGYNILGTYVHTTNRYGEPVKYKRYFLVRKKKDTNGFLELIRRFM